MIFKRLFRFGHSPAVAREVYASIVAKARQPDFYRSMGVSDSIDGRFDMITLHAILMMNRLARGSATARNFAQQIFDIMFIDMDRSLREMGVGDLSLGKRIRRMAEMFYGRAKAYREAIAANDNEGLKSAITRNVFPDGTALENIENLTAYCRKAIRLLDEQDEVSLLAGRIRFPDLPFSGVAHDP